MKAKLFTLGALLAAGACLGAFAADATPNTFGPYVWWHWAGTAVTKEGIVRDLDAMRDAGVAGATIFQVARGPCSEQLALGYEDDTDPALVFGSDAWCDMVAFAAHEAKKRGISVGMHNCPGYTVSGGPWITPALAMKKLVWTSAPKGQTPPQPETNLGFYRDVGTVDVGDTTYRFGYTCTGSQCMPVAKALWNNCLEADKMSAKAVNAHLDHVLRRPLGLDFILMDSYEAGPYDWTDDFREAFAARRGYDPLPHLPAYVGAVKDGVEKIRADMARTIQELSTERHYWVFRDRLHAAGLKFIVEPYGGPFDACEAAYASDVPTTEFWGARPFWVRPGEVGGHPQMGGAAGRAAGRTILAAEAYTSMPFEDPYLLAPRDFKAATDASFARGINRMFLHHWVHQPFPACRKPGMNMGYWGAHFGENATWFEPGKAFFAYLSRCQARLQKGEEVIDVLAVEDFGGRTDGVDVVPRRVFQAGLRYADGRAVVPDSGRAYPFLAVPRALRADPAVAAELMRARAAGVRVLAEDAALPPRPFRVADGVAVGPNGPVLGTSRVVRDAAGETRFFFVANVSTNAVAFTADFRATGEEAELWYPGTDETERRACARTADGASRLEMALAPQESVFVTFAPGAAKGELRRETPTQAIPLDGRWTVSFEAGRGAPAGERTLARLASWTTSDDFGVRHFSGTATYRLRFALTADAARAARRLALGDVRDIARVRLNGRDLGVAWHAPFEVKVDGAAREGENVLEVEVTNGWHNRLIADHNLADDDCEWGPERFHQCAMDGAKASCGRGLRRIPGWAWQADGSRPSTNRVTFTSWDYFRGDEPLAPSGLLGPVVLRLGRDATAAASSAIGSDALDGIGNVRLKGRLGETLDRMIANCVAERDVDYITACFLEKTETKGWWQTEFWGKYMHAAVPYAVYSGSPKIAASIRRGVERVLASQEPCGYIGNYPDALRCGDGWDVWGMKYTMMGLLHYYDLVEKWKGGKVEKCGEEGRRVLSAVKKLCDYVIGEIGPGGKRGVEVWQTGNWSGLASSSILEPVVWLYRRVAAAEGEAAAQKYLDFATFIVKGMSEPKAGPRLVDLALAGVSVADRNGHGNVADTSGSYVVKNNRWKAYEMMSCYQGLLDYAAVAGGRDDLKKAALMTARDIAATEVNLAGGCASSEAWYHGATKQHESYERVQETCVTTTWMRLCERLLAETDDPVWADYLERAFYNAYLGSLKADGSEFEAYTPLSGTRWSGMDHCYMHTDCCTANGPRGFLCFLKKFFVLDEKGATFNFYSSALANAVRADGRTVAFEMYSRYPRANYVRIVSHTQDAGSFPLRLRIPAWSAKTEVKLNGEVQKGVRAGAYVTLEREWRLGDIVEVAFDMPVVAHVQNNFVAYTRGPVLLARDSRFDDGDLMEPLPPKSVTDGEVMTGFAPTVVPSEEFWMAFSASLPLGQHKENQEALNPTTVFFCDFASAGNRWSRKNYYRTWFPVEKGPASRD